MIQVFGKELLLVANNQIDEIPWILYCIYCIYTEWRLIRLGIEAGNLKALDSLNWSTQRSMLLASERLKRDLGCLGHDGISFPGSRSSKAEVSE
jgi:hypothetical protein